MFRNVVFLAKEYWSQQSMECSSQDGVLVPSHNGDSVSRLSVFFHHRLSCFTSDATEQGIVTQLFDDGYKLLRDERIGKARGRLGRTRPSKFKIGTATYGHEEYILFLLEI